MPLVFRSYPGRRPSREVKTGRTAIGGENPVRVQSMLTSDTMDTAACVKETLGLAQAGCEIVRITAPTVKDARNLEAIRDTLHAAGCDVPLVADIHFKPEAALEAAKWVDKVRINPGNFADSKKFNIREYTDTEYAAEISRIRERFAPAASTDFVHNLLNAATNIGSLLCDGIGDAVLVQGEEAPGQSLRIAYNILQAAGVRIFKTDYVACPSCGRTLFNLQETTARIKAATSHLKGVKIAIMGCIVNGPGEMADADFGYVGGAPGKVNLYVGKTPVKFNIPQAEAVDRLVDLIREHGRWVEPVGI